MRKFISKILLVLFVLTLGFAGTAETRAASSEATVTVKDSKGTVATFIVDKNAARGGLQDAFDYVRDNGSPDNILTIVLPKGEYKINASLNIYSNTTLDLSKGVTFKRICDSSMIRFGRGTDEDTKGYNGYKNITIKGAKDNYAKLDGGAKPISIMRFAHADAVKLQYLELTNVNKGHHIEFAGSKDVVIDSCKFTAFSPMGVDDKRNYEAVHIDVLLESSFSGYGKYDGTVSKDITITNNVFEDVNRGVGAHRAQIGVYIKNVNISNNTFKNVTGYAIVATNFVNATIKDNVISDAGSGIFFRHISPDYVNYCAGNKKTINTNMNSVISGNVISLKNTAFDNTRYGISVYGEKVAKKVKSKEGVEIPAADFRVANVTVTDNRINSTVYANGIWVRGTFNSKITDNVINFTIAGSGDECDGIKLEQASGNTITGNKIADKAKKPRLRHGFYIKDGSDKNTIKSNTVTNVVDNGVYIYQSSGCTVAENTLTKAKKHGVYVDSNAGTKKKPTQVTKNTIKSPGERGVCVNDKSYANIKQNKITSCGAEGIYVAKKSNASIISNVVKTTGSHGIYVKDFAKAAKVQSNKIEKAAVNGIYVMENAQVTSLSKNTISDVKKNGIYVSSNANAKVIEGNTIKKVTNVGIAIYSEKANAAVKSNTISDCKAYGLDIAIKAKVTAKDNTITKCTEAENRIQGTGNKKIDTSLFKVSKVKKSGKSVVLTWNTIKNVDKYIVYRSTSEKGKYVKVGESTKNTYKDKSVKKNTTYYYKVIPYTKYTKSTIEFKASPIVSIKYK